MKSSNWRRWRRTSIGLVTLALAGALLASPVALGDGAAIPWGAMYTPNEHLTDGGMTGAVKAYRGTRGAETLLADLPVASERGVRLILTLGGVSPGDYLDAEGSLDFEIVERELAPFLEIAEAIAPYIESGTVWGIRFLDEPHDPSGYPRSFEIDPIELGEAYARIREHFGGVRIGSTAPPAYMIRVPGAGVSFGQVVHAKLPPDVTDPVDFHRRESALAHEHGLAYVASLNANTNGVDDETFFRDYRRMCEIESVDFATSWQWPQGHHPCPSFGIRFATADPAVQTEIAAIPAACER